MRTSIAARERVPFSDASEVVGASGTPLAALPGTKKSLFQPNFRVENCVSRFFSAMAGRTRPINACRNTTQRALSTHLYSIASPLSLPDLDEKYKNRLISPGRGETRLNSCVYGVHEGRCSIDDSSSPRVCCKQSIEQGRDP